MTPNHANQSYGQVRRAGVESALEDTEEAVSNKTTTASARSAQMAAAAQFSDVDSILDEIDSVIETNAAAFVQGFVQKGGQ